MKYKKKGEITKEWLIKNHFRYDSSLSSNDCECYILRFPVYKWANIITLEAEIRIYMDNKEILVNVYDGGTRHIYAPFYYQEYGNYDVIMEIIDKKICDKINQLGIKRYE